MQALLARFELLLYKWAGQWFPESRHIDLKKALFQAAEHCGFADRTNDFLLFLEKDPPSAVKDEIIQSILVGETYFFRDKPLWDSLKEEILPDIIATHSSTRTMRFWSAGCSTGEEAYSLALTIRELTPALNGWNLDILATDISEQSLNKARQATYNQRSTREVPQVLQSKWFESVGTNLKLKKTICDMVHFAKHNLCALDFPNESISQMDIIFCRNVLIYLSKDYVNKIITKFCKCLSPHSWLILAPIEIPFELPSCLQMQHTRSRLLVLRPKYASKIATSLQQVQPISKLSLSQFCSDTLYSLPNNGSFSVSPTTYASSKPLSAASQAAKLANRARDYADRGDFAQALIAATQSIDSCPTYTDGWLILATVQGELELHEEAIESLHRALYLDPNVAAAYLQLAQVMYKAKDCDFRRYIHIFNKLVENMDDNALLTHSLGLKVSEAKHLADALVKIKRF